MTQFSRRKPIDEATWAGARKPASPTFGQFHDAANYEKLRANWRSWTAPGTRGNRLFYLRSRRASSRWSTTSSRRRASSPTRADSGRYSRVIVEKPFGHDLASAEALNAELHRVFHERQIFRIDHYLGKETVQNLMVLRFGNTIFEPIWNRHHIDHVQITVAEDIGVEGRGKFYEEAGTTRDIVQNHLLQILMVVAMEPPVAFTADEVRDEKVKVLRALKPIRGRRAEADGARPVRCGQLRRARRCAGYREEPNVQPDSHVETYVAMRLEFDNWRFAGVPIYIRAGKRLTKRITEISVHFKDVPHALLDAATGSRREPDVARHAHPARRGDRPAFRGQGPGAEAYAPPGHHGLPLRPEFGSSGPEAYERLILDAMRGDPTLFTRADEVSAAWKFITPIHRPGRYSRRATSRTTPPAPGVRRRRRTSSRATGAPGGACELSSNPTRRALPLDRVERELALLWEEESRSAGGSALRC